MNKIPSGGATVKVILSRKGFDSDYGGYASPILPDGRVISLPIPRRDPQNTYGELVLEHGRTYYDLMKELKPKVHVEGEWEILTRSTLCHLDPDIRRDVKERHPDWKPAFGQVDGAQTHLENQGVGEGDIFLFFGWFRKTTRCNERLLFDPQDRDGRHVIFGYLQIGEVLGTVTAQVPEWLSQHPHANDPYRLRSNNTIYIAREALSWSDELPGAGLFNYRQDLVLTKEGFPRSRWDLPDFMKNADISLHSQKSWNDNYFQSAARGQEFVIQDDPNVEEWTKSLVHNTM